MSLRWAIFSASLIVSGPAVYVNGWKSPCETPDYALMPFCNMNLDPTTRAKDLVSRLTLEDKAQYMSNDAGGMKSVPLQSYQIWNEALHGVGKSPGVIYDKEYPAATVFPQVLHTAASFNRTLFGLIGSAISTEARAFANGNHAGLTFWAPNINIFRDPRWGRGQETPGEDPKYNGDYAEHFVRGFQEDPADPSRLKASACCKHFAAYNLELWKGIDREGFNAIVTDRDMHESFLPAFEACVRRGKVSALMCSYNAINGVPSCVNKNLMTTYAREKWGFDGYITTDCMAGYDVSHVYHYKNHTPEEAVGDMLDAGVNSGCDASLKNNAVNAVRSKFVLEETVDKALEGTLKVMIRLGMFDQSDAQPFRKIGKEALNTAAHQQLSLEAANQGMVLLKNALGTLPFGARLQGEIALIGPQSKVGVETLLGNYEGIPPFIVTLSDGIGRRYSQGHVSVLDGCDRTGSSHDDLNIAAAEGEAARASQTILAVGIKNPDEESEGKDRETITLPGRQAELVKRVAAAAKRAGKPPVVVVVVAGGMLDISEILENSHVGAVLWAGYAGMFAGKSVAETLFGDHNPSGRLPQTFYPASFVDRVNMTDMNMHPDPARGFPGRGYRFYNGEVVLPYGFGLSYTTFAYSTAVAGRSRDSVGDADLGGSLENGFTEVDVTITNTGNLSGSAVALFFVRPPADAVRQGAHGDLQRKLVDYVRTPVLLPGQSTSTRLQVHHSELSVFALPSAVVPSKPDFLPSNDPTGSRWRLEIFGGHEDTRSEVLL